MKTDNKYRFSLQWGAETDEKIQAGDFLEGIGNRKSEFVVLAVTEYLAAHPEALAPGHKLQIVVNPSLTRDQIRDMIVSLINERTAGMARLPEEAVSAGAASAGTEAVISTYVDTMLNNMDIFGTG